MKMFWFFWLQFRQAYDSTYSSVFWFSLGSKHSYNSDYDSNSNSVASESQPSMIPEYLHVQSIMQLPCSYSKA